MKTLLSVLLLLVFAFGAVMGEDSEGEYLIADRLRAEQSFENLKGDFPGAKRFQLNGRTSRVYGTSIGFGVTPEASAKYFIENHSAIFSADEKDLVPGSILAPEKKATQGVMYDRNTGQYKFILVYYHQERNGIPVYGGELRILVKNEPGYPVVLVSSAARSLGDFSPAGKSSVNFDLAEFAARAEVPSLDKFDKQEAVIWAGYNDNDTEPTMAASLIAYNNRAERWQFVVDAVSGEVLYKEDLIIFEDVEGDALGRVTQDIGSEQCENESNEPFAYARVNIGTEVVFADENGSFTIPNAGTDPVTVEMRAWGTWFRVYNYTGSDAVVSRSVNPPGPTTLTFNDLNSSEYIRAQANAYVEANVIRDMVVSHNPSYPGITQNQFPIYVNRTDFYCPANAWYDPGDVSLNFCQSSGDYPNTAWSSVLHHEYGHHLVDMAGSGQDQYGEGMGDCMSVLLSDSPLLGLGFYGDCVTSLRNADNTMQYPCTGEAHDCAGLLSGSLWDTRNHLMNETTDYISILQDLTVNSILMHTGSSITPQITIDFLTLDDDDGNLDNGTPHWSSICYGFGLHNMDCPELIPIVFEYPGGLPESIEPGTETVFTVEVVAGGDTPVSGTGMFHYSIDGGTYNSALMIEISPNLYEATFPSIDCENSITWYVSADAAGFGEVSDPVDAPLDVYSPIVATELTDIFTDNFQTNQGWTVSGDAADGQWTRGVPVGGGDRGDPPNDFDGSGACYLTDNVDDNSDVDDGTTYLISPIFDLSGGDGTIHYARWYSNTAGDDPNNDIFYVRVSNNAGGSWVEVEAVGPVNEANGGWYENTFNVSDFVSPTSQVQVRFEASDLGSGSVVEAGIDDFWVKSIVCESNIPSIVTEAVPDWTAGYPLSLQLEAVRGTGVLTWSDLNGDLAGTGLTLSGTGMLSGTPTSGGSISFTARVVDEVLEADEKVFTFMINDAVAITTADLPDWTAGAAMSQQLIATGGTAPMVWSDLNNDLSGTGLALNAVGVLSGTPTGPGPISFTAVVSDNIGSSDQMAYNFTVNDAIAITTTSVPNAAVSTPYSYQIEAENGTGQHTWSVTDNGLFLTNFTLSTDGILAGTSFKADTITFTARVTDEIGAYDDAVYTFYVGAGVDIQQIALPDWTVGYPYSQQLTATGQVGNLTWTDLNDDLSGTGLSLSTSGLISGTPTQSGTIQFTAHVDDDAGGEDQANFTILVNPGVSFTTSTLPDWTVGQPYATTLNASGGTGTISWSDKNGDLSGTGLALSSVGELTGTPASAGDITFVALISDQVGDEQEQQFQVHINDAVAIVTTSLPDGKEGDAYSAQLESNGGTGTHTWNDKNGDLSGTGLSLSSEGLLSGTPLNWGTLSFTASVVDITGSEAESLFEFAIEPPYICGDLDGDDDVDVLDIVFYVDWKYKSGPSPEPLERGDLNNDGEQNIIDILDIISFKFKDGPELDCGFGGPDPVTKAIGE